MLLANKAIWNIERNLGSDLTLAGIADACGVSMFHLSRAFGAATGRSVMTYVRGRRLSEAARTLAGNAPPDILSVALDAGYASHEAFTRAFREQFGTTPEAVRRGAEPASLGLIEPLRKLESCAANLEEPQIETAKPMHIVGLMERQSFDAPQRIPAQWQRFMTMYGLIERKLNPIPLGVSLSPDEYGSFDYLCGVEAARDAEMPKGLKRFSIPAQTCAKFQHRGHVSGLGDTYVGIWNSWLIDNNRTAADGPSLERHNPTFDPRTGEGGLEILIPMV